MKVAGHRPHRAGGRPRADGVPQPAPDGDKEVNAHPRDAFAAFNGCDPPREARDLGVKTRRFTHTIPRCARDDMRIVPAPVLKSETSKGSVP